MAAMLDITRGITWPDLSCVQRRHFMLSWDLCKSRYLRLREGILSHWQLNRATQRLLRSSEVISAAGVFLMAVDLSEKMNADGTLLRDAFNAVYNLSNQASPFHSRRTSMNHQLRFILWRPQIALHSVGTRPIFEERGFAQPANISVPEASC